MSSNLFILFLSSFLAATLLPAQSELMIMSLDSSTNHDDFLLVLVATFGNVLGALVNFILGYYFINLQDRKWFPIKKNKLKKANKLYEKWGVWSLLFAWLPIIGDPLTFIAGMFRTNIWLFLLLVTLGKSARYIALVLLI